MLIKRNQFQDPLKINLRISENLGLEKSKLLIEKKFTELEIVPIILKYNKKRIIGMVFDYKFTDGKIIIKYVVDLDCLDLKNMGIVVKKTKKNNIRMVCFYME